MKLAPFPQTKKILEEHKIPLVETRKVTSLDEAEIFIKKFDFPVVLKAYSSELIHKTEEKGVWPNIRNSKKLKEAFSFLSDKFNAEIFIQPHIKGKEMIVGLKKDPSFGSVIVCGLGGIFTEIFKDSSYRIPPIEQKEAQDMLKELKSYTLLTGFRGSKPVNLEELVNFLIKISRLPLQETEFKEIEFNPVIVNTKTALAVDAKIYL